MRLKKVLITLAALVMMAVSCVKVDYTFNNRIPTNTKGEYAIVFSNPGPMTKAVANSTSGTGYDEFVLYTWNAINDTIMNPYLVQADGAASYVYDGINSQTLQYFKNVTDWYDFIGVIPTTHTMELKDGTVTVAGLHSFVVDDKRAEQAVNLTDTLYWNTGLAVDSPEEFLWSYKRVEKANYGSTVELPFNHGNALVFIGFSSDRTDTELLDYAPGTPDIPAVPEVRDTTDRWFNLKCNVNVNGSPTSTKAPGSSSYVDNYQLPAELVAEIKSYYSVDGVIGTYVLGPLNKSNWHAGSDTNCGKELRIVKEIPTAYRMPVERTDGTIVVFFDALKYLKDNGYDVQPRNDGGKPGYWGQPVLDCYVNGTAYSLTFFDYSLSSVSVLDHDTVAYVNKNTLEYAINVTPGTPAVPGRPTLEGVRVFSADSTGVNNLPADTLYCVHIPHTMTADATISSTGCVLSNRTTSDDVIGFTLPSTTTLSSTPVWSPSTFYALPGDADFNFIVVKLSYTYNGVTAYDVRVPIHLPDGGLVPGKYYKYELYITSTGNGTNDPDEARDEKDEILIESNPVISVKLVDTGYTQGDERKITI